MSRVFGPYDILRELGRGAMGVVSLAEHRSLKRQCALKTISLKLRDPHAAERFIHEGQAVARLGKHPHIVQVFDAGIVDDVPYIAMEFVEGETLEHRVQEQGTLPEAELIEIGRKLALALDHAHRRGIVHRDVKPANVIIDKESEPQLLDFGIAKDLHSSGGGGVATSFPAGAEETLSGTSIVSGPVDGATLVVTNSSLSSQPEEGIQGTPAFMAPEQADPRRGPVDARSDIYALGATLYVLATGRRPIEAGTLTEMLVRVVTQRPSPLANFVEINPDLEAVILKSLEKNPAVRYQTALEFADDLSRVTMGLPTRARRLGRLGLIGRTLRRHAKLVGLGAAFVLLAGILSGYFLFRSREIQALWNDIAQRTARSTAQEVRSLLDPAIPMLEECSALAELGLLPVDNSEQLAPHLVARFRFQKKLSWLSYGDDQGRFTGAWRHPSGRIVIQRSWLDAQGGHVREQFADGDRERLRWEDNWTYDPRTRPFYQLASGVEVPVWTKPYEWFGDEGLGITSALAWRPPGSKQVRGVFTADYHLRSLSDFLANLKLGRQGRAYLLSREGELLASPERGATALDELLTAAIHKSEQEVNGGIKSLPADEPHTFSFEHAGMAYVAAMEAFQPAEGFPIVTVVLVPEEDITGPVRDSALRAARIVVGMLLLAALALLLAGIVQKRRLIKSLAGRKRRKVRRPAINMTMDKTTIGTAQPEEER